MATIDDIAQLRAIIGEPSEHVRLKLHTRLNAQAREFIQRDLDQNGWLIQVKTLEEGIKLANQLAPEHCEIMTRGAAKVAEKILTAGAIFSFVAARWGSWAALLAAGAWVLQPNLFGHGHYAAYDGILTSLWMLAILVFDQAATVGPSSKRAATRWGWTSTLGLIFGCAAATKLTGWFLPLPFLVWAGLYRSRQSAKTLFFGLLIAIRKP